MNKETQRVVPPRKFNKNAEGAWRLDINVSVQNGNDDTSNKESDMEPNDGSDTSNSGSSGSELNESDSDDNIQSDGE